MEAAKKSPFSSPFTPVVKCNELSTEVVPGRTIALAAAAPGKLHHFQRRTIGDIIDLVNKQQETVASMDQLSSTPSVVSVES